MNKLKIALQLLLTKNYLVISDRHSSASVRQVFLKSFREQLKLMDKKLLEGAEEYERSKKKIK